MTSAQGNTSQGSNNETMSASNVTLQLHAQLDAAIVAAQNNDTLGVLTSLSQIVEGLGEMNNPAGNATEIAATSNPDTASNQTAGNQSGANSSHTTTSGGVGTDNPASGSDNPYSDFT